MPRDIRNRRTGARQKVPKMLFAEVELTDLEGLPRKCRLIDLSMKDLCFETATGEPRIEPGTNLANAMIRVANFEVCCHISIARTWKQFDAAHHCGGTLFPKSEDDQNELASVVAALEAAEARSPSA